MLEAREVTIHNQGEDSCFTLEAPSLLFPDRGLFLLLGDSGSGKTTLLEALQGLRPLSKGKILSEGKERISFDPSETTYCPAGGLAVPSLSVTDNLRLATGDMEEGERILRALHFPEGFRRKKASKLSVGERARLSLAMALLSPGKSLFLDEPTANLDKENAGRAFALLHEESRRSPSSSRRTLWTPGVRREGPSKGRGGPPLRREGSRGKGGTSHKGEASPDGAPPRLRLP